MLDDLQGSYKILKLNFKRGDPCGDVLHAILEGKDGRATVQSGVRNRLQNIAAFVKLTTPKPGKISVRCQNCCKGDGSEAFQKSLMHCSRCKQACYCSKACQTADWKRHKTGCVRNGKDLLKRIDVVEIILDNFMTNTTTYFYLINRMVLALDETGMKLRDMVMELDFMADENGIVPALQNPPCYTIVPKQAYFEAPGRSDSDIFNKHGQEDYERIVTCMKEQHQTKTESCAFIIRYNYGVFCMTPQTGIRFSDEAIENFR
mmetsp:Transcript_2554/g.6122  ORF Transcript_2554/g.6122 Transcript_2554/m.6122 type:complete len:261 (+) Transcript_2554:284-1066(+)